MTNRVRIAFARQVPPTLSSGVLAPGTNASTVNVAVASAQHGNYIALLRKYCDKVHVLPATPQYPDSVFIEDAAVVSSGRAMLGRAGHPTRDGEAALLAPALKEAGLQVSNVDVRFDGGDVLNTGDCIFVGISSRTERSIVNALKQTFGTDVIPVTVADGTLHLKCVVSYVRNARLLVAQDCVVGRDVVAQITIRFDGDVCWVPPQAHGAANVLDLGSAVMLQKNCWLQLHGLRGRLEKSGISAVACDTSELLKANGLLTCSSIVVWD